MKKLVFLFTMMFAVCMAMAQVNVSEIESHGTANQVAVDQTNVDSPVPGNTIFSWVGQWGTGNIAEVDQEQSDKHAKVEEMLEAYIDQLGEYNKAKQIQGPSGKQGGTSAKIRQEGVGNDAFQQQIYYWNEAEIWQYGTGNIAKQSQDLDLPEDATGSANWAYAEQHGQYNLSEQEQHGWSNKVSVLQEGVGNRAFQTQQNYSWKSDATIRQWGTGNESTQDQKGNLNFALSEQSGDYNFASQTQVSDGVRANSVYDPLNDGEVFQFGVGNRAIQMQTIPSEVLEDILPNFATATQDGIGNQSSQTQFGGNNSSSVLQTGNYNSAVLTQSQNIIQP
ncbi:hypothetical protein [uncultured Sunxiuqinia sp.]|jgi:curlin associated repeat protein|uniref:hypothetical protein n=1 Tax=uncultured Sunxiuqinia sp. TaxID=1573825 RepID=UPI0030DC6131|tara:strand:+ start:2499 stop:3506 length:1008 start_codon:yes stop_codon:yes gene_type:complete